MKQRLFGGIALAALVGCASNEIIVDTKGIDMAAYERDLADCRQYSEQVETGKKTASGAAGGAVVGGLIGAIFDGPSGAARGAGAGAVTGGASGVREGERDENQVVKRCLSGRGYRVLN